MKHTTSIVKAFMLVRTCMGAIESGLCREQSYHLNRQELFAPNHAIDYSK